MTIRDSNKQLRTAYIAALTGISYNNELVPVYGQQVPDEPPRNYISVFSISNSEVSPKSAVVLQTLVTVGIYTNAPTYGDQDAVDHIAGVVLSRISQGLVLETDQMVSTLVDSDRTDSWTSKNQLVAMDRIITFRHRIMQREKEILQPDFDPADFDPADFDTTA